MPGPTVDIKNVTVSQIFINDLGLYLDPDESRRMVPDEMGYNDFMTVYNLGGVLYTKVQDNSIEMKVNSVAVTGATADSAMTSSSEHDIATPNITNFTDSQHTHKDTAGGGVNGILHADVSGEINGVTAKTTLAVTDVALIEDSAATYAKKKAVVSAFYPPATNITTATAATATTSTSATLILGGTSMTVTPVAGTYLVMFSAGDCYNTTRAQSVYFSIWTNDGVTPAQVSGSERRILQHDHGTGTPVMEHTCAAINTVVTVNGTTAIEARWRVSANTGNCGPRALTILRVN